MKRELTLLLVLKEESGAEGRGDASDGGTAADLGLSVKTFLLMLC